MTVAQPVNTSGDAGSPLRQEARPNETTRPYRTLAQWNDEFPSLTRTQQKPMPWDKAAGEAS